jgi:hypothetical protein
VHLAQQRQHYRAAKGCARRRYHRGWLRQFGQQSGNLASGSNYREDVPVDGNLNSADISLVKAKSGTALP